MSGTQVALVYWSLLGIQELGHAGRNHLWFDYKERPGSTLALKHTAKKTPSSVTRSDFEEREALSVFSCNLFTSLNIPKGKWKCN